LAGSWRCSPRAIEGTRTANQAERRIGHPEMR
jgi:hypothetical protein